MGINTECSIVHCLHGSSLDRIEVAASVGYGSDTVRIRTPEQEGLDLRTSVFCVRWAVFGV